MHILRRVLDLLLPDHCLLCGIGLEVRSSHLMCPHCWLALPRNITACRVCAQHLPVPGVCGACQLEPLVSGRTIAPLNHIDEAKYLIHQFKYHHDFRAGQALASLIAWEVRRTYQDQPLPQCMVPVPLSYIRQVQRGYNQAAWLGRCLRKELHIPLATHAITRRHGPAQHTLSRRARLRFKTHSLRQKRALPYAHVAIIDDVLTTGATCSAMARILKSHGAKQIDIWCATRTQANRN